MLVIYRGEFKVELKVLFCLQSCCCCWNWHEVILLN